MPSTLSPHALTFLTDRRGLDLARFSIASFVLSQRQGCDIHLTCDGFTLPLNDALRTLCSDRGFELIAHVESSDRYCGMRTANHISRTQFLKLASVQNIVNDYSRVVYVDTDFLFLDEMQLAETDFGDNPLAACYDVAEASGITDPEFRGNCKKTGRSHHYFNSGLMIFDCAKIDFPSLKRDYESLLIQHQQHCDYKSNCRTNDQCVWNMLFEDRWKALPVSWNVQSSMRFTDYWDNAIARHYTGPKKFLDQKSWRSDATEIAFVRKISLMIGPNISSPVNPVNAIYRLNAIRWYKARRRIEIAAAGFAEPDQN